MRRIILSAFGVTLLGCGVFAQAQSRAQADVDRWFTAFHQQAPAAKAGAQDARAPGTVDYDTFMQQDLQGRIGTFNQVTPENRAELVQTLIKRWVEKNKARLTPEQVKVMDENLAYVTADRYRRPMTSEEMAQAKDLEVRTAAVFSREDMIQALTIYADYIPKKG